MKLTFPVLTAFTLTAALSFTAGVRWSSPSPSGETTGSLGPARAASPATSLKSQAGAAAGSIWQERLLSRLQGAGSLDERGLLSALRSLDTSAPDATTVPARHILLALLAEKEPETAVSYAESRPAAERSATALTAYAAWATHDPEKAAQYFAQNGDDFGTLSTAQRETAGVLAAAWAARDPDAAAAWIDSLPEDQRGVAQGQLITTVNKTDPQRAAAFINDMDEGYGRTELIQSLTREQAGRAPEKTAAWVLSIDGDIEQKAAASTLVSAWAARDISAAAAWTAALPAGPSRDAAATALILSPAFMPADRATTFAWAVSIRDQTLRNAALLTAERRHPGASAPDGDGL